MKRCFTSFRQFSVFVLVMMGASLQQLRAQDTDPFNMMPAELLAALNADEEPPGGAFNEPKGLESIVHNRKEVYVAFKNITGKYIYEPVYRARPGTDIVSAGYKLKYNTILVLLNDGSIARIDYDNGYEEWGIPHTVPGNGILGIAQQLVGDDLYVLSQNAVFVLRDSLGPWKIDTAGLADFTQLYELAIDSSQNVWLSTSDGIYMQALNDSVWTAKAGSNLTVGVNVDKQQRIWATGTGVLKVSNNGAAFVNGPTGLPNNEVIIKVVSDWQGDVYALTGSAAFLKSGKRIYRSVGGTQAFTRIDQTLANDFTSFGSSNIYNDIAADTQLIVVTVAGLHSTANGGTTWSLSGGPRALRSAGIVRTNDNSLLASGPSGLYKGDAGNWVKKHPAQGYQDNIKVFRDNSGNLYAQAGQYAANSSGNYRNLIYKSSNNGDSWNVDSAGAAAADVGMDAFYVDENGTQHAAASVYIGGQGNRFTVWKKETGQSWALDTVGLPELFNNATAISFNSDGQGNVIVCFSLGSGAASYKRALSGTSWSAELALGAAKVLNITSHNAQLVVASDMAIYRKNGGSYQPLPLPAGINANDVVHTAAAFDFKGVLWAYFESFLFSSNFAMGHGFYYTTDLTNWHVSPKNVDTLLFNSLVAIGDSVFALPNGSNGVYVLDTSGANQPVAIVETQNIADITILPNPATSDLQITLQLNRSTQTDISVLDLSGKVVGQVANGYYNSGKQQFNFNVSNLPAGQYLCRVKTEEGISMKKFLVAK